MKVTRRSSGFAFVRSAGFARGGDVEPIGVPNRFIVFLLYDSITEVNSRVEVRVRYDSALPVAVNDLIGVAQMTVYANGGVWMVMPLSIVNIGITQTTLTFRVQQWTTDLDGFPPPLNSYEGCTGSHGTGSIVNPTAGWDFTESNELMDGGPGAWAYYDFPVASSQARTLTKA